MMMNESTLREAAEHLAKSDKGRDALRRVLDWLENSGLSLDSVNQDAILLLLDAAWNGWAGSAREVMHDALATPGGSFIDCEGNSHGSDQTT